MFAIDPPTAPASFEPPAIVAAADIPRPQLEVSSATLPRFDSARSASRTSRIDMSLMPQRPSGVGVAFGVSSLAGADRTLMPWAANVSTVDFGIHWRVALDSNYRFDVTAYRRVPDADAMSMIESHDPSYGARVELGMGSIQGRSRGFMADRGFLGFQLESGARVSVKRNGHGPMLYYRNSF